MHFNPKDGKYAKKKEDFDLVSLSEDELKDYAVKASSIRKKLLGRANDLEHELLSHDPDAQDYISKLEKRLYRPATHRREREVNCWAQDRIFKDALSNKFRKRKRS